MAGLELGREKASAEKYQILTEGHGPNLRVSIIESDDDSYFTGPGRRKRWKVFIPDAGSEVNAARVTRLLNAEVQEVIDRRAQREALEDSDDIGNKDEVALG